MNYDYSKRGYLLPHGCKDLSDVIGKESGDHFVLRVRLPGLLTATLTITVEGRSNRISGKQTGSQDPYENVFEAPVGYDLAQARASYLNGEPRIVVPKASA